jgi:hypothetical protein
LEIISRLGYYQLAWIVSVGLDIISRFGNFHMTWTLFCGLWHFQKTLTVSVALDYFSGLMSDILLKYPSYF